MSKKALIIIAEGFEEIETVTPIDILRRANVDVVIAGLNPDERIVKGSRGLCIKTETSLDDLDGDFDACILPGGPGVRHLAESEPVKSLISLLHSQHKLIAAICAAPAIVLAPLGILDGKKATCYLGMETNFSKSTTFVPENVVIDDNVITSRGPGTAMHFALIIVEKLVGKKAADTIKTNAIIS